MIGALPKTLTVNEKSYAIRSDFRVAMIIFESYNNADLSDTEKTMICLYSLYVDVPDDITEALEQAMWFLDGGNSVKLKQLPVKTIDWEQDESLLFPEINKSAGCEVRALDYCHWWTFLGYFSTMGEGLYPHILNIRQKCARGKPLEKWEREFFNEHKEMIILHEKLTAEEQAEIDSENALFDEIFQ